MKIAISQREIVLANSVGERLVFDGIERAWYTFLADHELITIPNTVNLPYIGILDFDCLLLTGGPDSQARHLTENMLYAVALERNVPILGICHGAFAVNDLSGGINGRVTGHEHGQHAVVMDDIAWSVNSHHSQSIAKLGPGMITTAIDLDGNIEAFEHETKPIYGIVWHPERMMQPILPTSVSRLLDGH
jgi:putative glutamine amidotransferase